MGNPPFVGGMNMTSQQKEEIRNLFDNVVGAGEFDYVTGWYKKDIEYTNNTEIKTAFVSTNSICQGSSVVTFWKYLVEKCKIYINFAYTSFVWNSEATIKANVYCVIVGFSHIENKNKRIYSEDDKNNLTYKLCENISPYLTDSNTVFIETRSDPLCNVPKMRFGSMPRDGGNLILTVEEKEKILKSNPEVEKYIKLYIGADEFIKNKERYCLWLVDADSKLLNKCPMIKERIEKVKKFRESSKANATRKFATTPSLFCQIAQPNSDYIIVPETTSSRRRYIPIGFMNKDVIASNLVFLIPDANLYEFGVLTSNVHNSWMRVVCGRLGNGYRYSKDIVYNNFPWPTPTPEQSARIEETAKGILDVRKKFPSSSLADLYDPTTMPYDLQKAHTANNKAVMSAYGFKTSMTEEECVAKLFELYKELTKK